MQGVALGQDLEHLDGRRGDHRGDGIGEEIRAGTLTEHVDDLFPAGGETTYGATEGFAKGAGKDVDAPVAVELLGYAAAGLADYAGAVALVHHHQGVILLGQVADLVHRGDIAVHGEDTVGADDAEPLGLGFLEATLQVCHVRIGIAVPDRLAKTDAVNDGSVVERVGDDGILRGQQRLEDAAVGVETRSIEDGVLRMEEVGNSLFQLFVQILGSADEADGGHTVAALVHGLLGRVDQSLGIRQAEVIVGTEIQCYATVLEGDFRALGRGDVPFVLVQASLLDGGQFILQVFLEFTVHGYREFSCFVLQIYSFSRKNTIIYLFTLRKKCKFAHHNI